MNQNQLEEIQKLTIQSQVIDYVKKNLKTDEYPDYALIDKKEQSEFFIEKKFESFYLEFPEKRWVIVFHLNDQKRSEKLSSYLQKNSWKKKIQGVWTYLTYGEENVLEGLTKEIKEIGVDCFEYLEIISTNGCILSKVFKERDFDAETENYQFRTLLESGDEETPTDEEMSEKVSKSLVE